MHHAFLYISLPSLHDYDVKMPNCKFYFINKRRRISFSLSKLECGPQEINSREIRLHLPFSANWNKPDKDWKKWEFILKMTLSLSSMLKLPQLFRAAITFRVTWSQRVRQRNALTEIAWEDAVQGLGLAITTVASEKNRDMLFIGNVFYKQWHLCVLFY